MERPDIPRNFRDLGGLAGTGGKYIRPGKLWRSGQLYGASEGDLIWLRVHGLTAISDLRSIDEQRKFPDAVPENATFRSFPLIERETREPGLTGLIKLLRKEGRSGEEYLVDYYGSLVRDPHAADELRCSLICCSRRMEEPSSGVALPARTAPASRRRWCLLRWASPGRIS